MNGPGFSLEKVVYVKLLLVALCATAQADGTRVLPPGQLPNDRRLGELKDLNGYFPFAPPATPEAWADRSVHVRRQVLVATGLWPMPSKTPLNAVMHGKIDCGEYTVERVYFQSVPGHFVTGSLYRPVDRQGRLPGVLCPHGHWASGRFYDAGPDKIRQQIVRGEERFEKSGRYPLQARCVQLARMGCLVFFYDMVGYADNQQLAHRAGIRPDMDAKENWGYFSPQAELRLQTVMGLQTYNSVRALDWLLSLPDVDPERIAVTGASGGGTQTFILCAVDPRPKVSVPAVMVSTAMQGGCSCENACYLRVGTGNVEIAALFAPGPMGLLAADDWTKEIATKGQPELVQLYAMLGVKDKVTVWPFVQFPHNYNYVSRAAMYGWLNKYLQLGQEEPILEEDFQPLTEMEMSVWDDEHPRPPGGDDHERDVLRWMTEDSQQQMTALMPTDAESLERFRQIVGGAADVIVGRGLPEPGAIEASQPHEQKADGYRVRKFLVRNPNEGEEVPAILLQPDGWNKTVALWISPEGKRSVFVEPGRPAATVNELLDAGVAVIGLDLFGQGEFTTDGKPLTKQRLNASGRGDWAGYAGYTYGYNHPMFSQRVHDTLSAIAFVRAKMKPQSVYLVGLEKAGHWVAAALAQAGGAVDRAVVDTGGFRFADVAAIDHADFLPGGAKYLDLPGILALAAPTAVWLTGEGPEPPAVLAAAYRAAEQPEKLTTFAGDDSQKSSAAARWLLRQ